MAVVRNERRTVGRGAAFGAAASWRGPTGGPDHEGRSDSATPPRVAGANQFSDSSIEIGCSFLALVCACLRVHMRVSVPEHANPYSRVLMF